jgi:four helix bundle protein
VKPKCYSDLIAWQKAVDLAEAVYRATKAFPKEEQFGLTIQLRRAVVSVPSNIAEGQGRSTTREFLHFLSIAYGSLLEVETQIIIAQRLGYLDTHQKADLLAATGEVGRIVNGLARSLQTGCDPPPTAGR